MSVSILRKNFRMDLHEIYKEGWQKMKNWLNIGGDPDHRLDTGIVFQSRYYWEIWKAWLRCNYDVITSPAHDSATATAMHAACSVTGARYRETGKTGLGGGMHCPIASSFILLHDMIKQSESDVSADNEICISFQFNFACGTLYIFRQHICTISDTSYIYFTQLLNLLILITV